MPKLGMVIALPAGAEIAETETVQRKPGGYVVSKAIPNDLYVWVLGAPVTIEEARQVIFFAEAGPADILVENLDGGFALYYVSKRTWPNYHVDVFRTIGGKMTQCSTAANDSTDRQRAVMACKTLAIDTGTGVSITR